MVICVGLGIPALVVRFLLLSVLLGLAVYGDHGVFSFMGVRGLDSRAGVTVVAAVDAPNWFTRPVWGGGSKTLLLVCLSRGYS